MTKPSPSAFPDAGPLMADVTLDVGLVACRLVQDSCGRFLVSPDGGPWRDVAGDPMLMRAMARRIKDLEKDRDAWKVAAEDAHGRMIQARNSLAIGQG